MKNCPYNISDEFETNLFADDNTSYDSKPQTTFYKDQTYDKHLSTWSHLNGLTIQN